MLNLYKIVDGFQMLNLRKRNHYRFTLSDMLFFHFVILPVATVY